MTKVLWIAPNLNHYKSRFLSRLAENAELNLTVLVGAHMTEEGHRPSEEKEVFSRIDLNATKKNFQYHPIVYSTLARILFRKGFDVILMPVEKKFTPLILFLFFLKLILHYKLVSYNHPVTVSKNKKYFTLERIISKSLFTLYDKIIFYTKQGREWAIEHGLVPSSKAFFANNTLDTENIWQIYEFEINESESKTILFIGRLIPNKKIDALFEYYNFLKDKIPQLKLIVIGDGPEADNVKQAAQRDSSIIWRGAVVDENLIAEDMRRAHQGFVPDGSGLSIVHAFCYGKPYATIAGHHGPEITYLKDGENGFILSGNITEDCERISEFLNNSMAYEMACRAAYNKAKELSIENWRTQMANAITL